MLCPLDDSVGKNSPDVSDQIRSIATETVHIGLSCQCAALPVIFFLMFAVLVDIDRFDTSLSLAALSPSFYKGVKGRVFPLGKDIFQFKNGLFMEKGRALMYLLRLRAVRFLHVSNTWSCRSFKDSTGLHSHKWIFRAFLFFLRGLSQLTETLIDWEVHYQCAGETMAQQFSDIHLPMRIYRQRKTCWLCCFHITQQF